MGKFLRHSAGLKDAQRAGIIEFLDISVRVSPEEMSDRICRLNPFQKGFQEDPFH